MTIKLNNTMSTQAHCRRAIMAQLVELWSIAKSISDVGAIDRWTVQFYHDQQGEGWLTGVTGTEVDAIIAKEREVIQLSDKGLGYHITLVEEECTADKLVYREGIVGPALELARHITFIRLARNTFTRDLESVADVVPSVEPAH